MDNTPSPAISTSPLESSERRSVSRTRWAAIGAAVAVSLGGGTLAFVNAAPTAPVAPHTDLVPYPEVNLFVPITPCRLFDTRPSSGIGTRFTPIGAGEVVTIDVTGTIGYYGLCNLPLGITAILINITATSPTANSFLTIYPSDAPRPNASNLNFVAGQAPTANLVNVRLSNAGYAITSDPEMSPITPSQSFNIYNESGTVNVIGDVVGYYVPSIVIP